MDIFFNSTLYHWIGLILHIIALIAIAFGIVLLKHNKKIGSTLVCVGKDLAHHRKRVKHF